MKNQTVSLFLLTVVFSNFSFADVPYPGPDNPPPTAPTPGSGYRSPESYYPKENPFEGIGQRAGVGTSPCDSLWEQIRRIQSDLIYLHAQRNHLLANGSNEGDDCIQGIDRQIASDTTRLDALEAQFTALNCQ